MATRTRGRFNEHGVGVVKNIEKSADGGGLAHLFSAITVVNICARLRTPHAALPRVRA